MGLKYSKQQPNQQCNRPPSMKDSMSMKDPLSMSLKELIFIEGFKNGKLLIGKECFATTDPCEHDNCVYITSNLEIVELGRLDASSINKALKTGIYAEYSECKEVGLDEIIEHFQI